MSEEYFQRSETRILTSEQFVTVKDKLAVVARTSKVNVGEILPESDVMLNQHLLEMFNGVASQVEPYDSVLGIDPTRTKSKAFSQGVLCGLVVGREAFHEVTSVHKATKSLLAGIRELLPLPDEVAQRNQIAQWIMDRGGWGLTCVGGTETLFESIEDALFTDVTNRIFALCGFGLAISVYQHAAYEQSVRDIEATADTIINLSDNDIAIAMAELTQQYLRPDDQQD